MLKINGARRLIVASFGALSGMQAMFNTNTSSALFISNASSALVGNSNE